MSLSLDVKRKLYGLLPQDYIADPPFLDGRYKPPEGTHAEQIAWWAQQPEGFVFFAFSEDEIRLDAKTIKKIRIITSVELEPEELEDIEDLQDTIVHRITSHLTTDELLQIQNCDTSTEPQEEALSVDELWVESERIAQSIVLLKNRRSKATTQQPVATWNSKLASNWLAGPWIRVDMRFHPNERLRADGVLVVHVDHRNEDQSWAKLVAGESLIVEKEERSLFGVDDIDYPCLEVLEVKASKKIRDAISESPQACDEYEQGYWEECFPRDLFSHTNVYAQLGGWPITWPDEAADEQLGRQLVLRTYANSEPWIEVFRKGRKYEVVDRIT